ncbi:ricin B lectin domain-containing protein [Mycena maculata]|uniref:Ricin B lectin domain-containing protein n=1 Tax=Mycena maculata TaxID=230809 RepID=A0AAD7JVS3_9AGAR|nr:ricin B lectin domain-containing protein [Mycena maculata]
MWTLSNAGGGNWTLQNVRYSRKYLGLSGSVAPSVKLRAVNDSVHWSIRSDGHAYMLTVPNNSGLAIELNGSDIHLCPVDSHNTQLWEFTEVSHMLPEDAKDLLRIPPLSPSQPELVPGHTYKIKNCAAHTVLDLNDSDHQSIIGWKWGEGTNQMWTLSDAGGGNWTLQNVRYSRKYLGLSGSVAPGVKLRAVNDSVHWSICSDGHAYTLSVPDNSGLAIELNGSDILLCPVDGHNTQLWEFTEV